MQYVGPVSSPPPPQNPPGATPDVQKRGKYSQKGDSWLYFPRFYTSGVGGLGAGGKRYFINHCYVVKKKVFIF